MNIVFDQKIDNKAKHTDNWLRYLLSVAEAVKLKSKDPHTKIGAVIFNDDYTIISTGYNSFVRGLYDDVPERSERPEKYDWIEHAERNAIYNAAREGHRLKGTNLILTPPHFPCIECAKAIVQSGIKTLYAPKQELVSNTYKFDKSKQMLKECGVIYYEYYY